MHVVDSYSVAGCPSAGSSPISVQLERLTHLSARLVVVEVHEWLRELGALPALPAVAGVDEGARECDAEVDIVRASGPLRRKEFGYYCDIVRWASHKSC